MIGAPALLLLLAAQAGTPSGPPADWTVLVPLPWKAPPHISPDIADFVDEEVRAGRCTLPGDRPEAMTVDLAVNTRGNGTLRSVVPRAIGCPTVEQFAVGLIYSMARGNLRRTGTGWYHAQLVFPLTQ